jgi:streptogramin lyase
VSRPRVFASAALLVALFLVGGCDSDPPRLTIAAPLVLAYEGGMVRVEGQGFGQAGPGASVSVAGMSVAATDAGVTWGESAIEWTLPDGAVSGDLTVRTTAGATTSARLEIYRYEYYEIPPTSGTNAVPLALTRDARGALWINEEFHRELKVLDPGADAVRAVPIPHPPDPGPFAVYLEELFGQRDVDVRTQTSSLGESVITDPTGRVWFSEGGGGLYEPSDDGLRIHPNHSRIVSVDPANDQMRVYDIPGDRNEVIGLLWDKGRGLLWFAEGGRIGGGAITSLDPTAAALDPQAGYQRYLLPDRTSYPAHLALDDAGGIWFTEFLGNRVGRLDPDSGAIVELPLPARRGQSQPAKVFNTGGPWQIAIGPDGAAWFTESFDLSVGRIDVERVLGGDPACTRLAGDGANECIQEISVADPAQHTTGADLVHSLAFDWNGRLWFGQHGPQVAGPPDTLGVVLPDTGAAVTLPPLRRAGDPTPVGVTGIAVDPQNHTIWFNEFWSKRLSRLTLVA